MKDVKSEPLAPEVRDAIERAADELFVGRGRELVQLDAALKDALGGRGRMLLIAGEPGIGKTRLAERVAASAMKQGADVFWGRCWEGEGAPPFWPWLQIARAHLRGRGAAAMASRIGIGAPYLAQVMPEIREFLPDLPAVAPLDSEQARFRLYDVVATFLRAEATDKPIVFVIDDLHWADKSSLLLLQFLAREIIDARILVLATYRDVEVSAGHPLADVLPSLRRERTVDRILLRGLPEEEVRTLLVALRGGDVPETFAANLASETAGNPFFIREILRHLLEEGVAVREGNRWEPRIDEKEIRLPESVREVVGRRLARLGDPCRRLLTVASVIGGEFAFDVLERASEAQEGVLALLEEALNARVLEEVPQAIGRYRFSHALIRETLYEEIGTVERLRLHRVVAEALEHLFDHDADTHLSELAHHFLEALPGGDTAKAVEYATRAGDRAVEQLAHHNAVLLYRRALQALGLGRSADERLRCELLLKVGEAQWSAGGSRDPFEPFRQAAEIAERLKAPELLARAAIGLGGPGTWIAEADRQLVYLDKALSMMSVEETPLRALVMATLASRWHFRSSAGAYALPALEMARRLGDPATLAQVMSRFTWARWGADRDFGETLDFTQEMIHLAEQVGDRKLAFEGHLWRASHYLEIGAAAEADREVDAQLRIADTSREPYFRWVAALGRAARAFRAARLDESEAHYGEAMTAASELFGAAADPRIVPLDWGVGPALRRERRAAADEDIATYRMLTGKFVHPTWHIAETRMLLGAGRIDECREHWQRVAANDFADIPRDLNWLDSLSSASEIAWRLDDMRRARILYDLLLPYADRCVVRLMVCLGAVARPLGLLAITLSRPDDAERHFAAALAINEAVGAKVGVAHTQGDYARLLLTRNGPGDRERGAAVAAQGLQAARESGMHVLEQRIAAMLADTGLGAAADERPAATTRPMVESRFVLEGDFWSIAYEGKTLRLKDSKGLQYIAALIGREDDEIHTADLAAGRVGERPRDAGNAGEILDAQARSEYRERLRDLETELEEATRWNDAGRTARITEEIEFLKSELAAAFGAGGRARKAADSGERARKAVASRIRDAIDKIRAEHRDLALHLENAIRTGAFCCYRPDRSPGWNR